MMLARKADGFSDAGDDDDDDDDADDDTDDEDHDGDGGEDDDGGDDDGLVFMSQTRHLARMTVAENMQPLRQSLCFGCFEHWS